MSSNPSTADDRYPQIGETVERSFTSVVDATTDIVNRLKTTPLYAQQQTIDDTSRASQGRSDNSMFATLNRWTNSIQPAFLSKNLDVGCMNHTLMFPGSSGKRRTVKKSDPLFARKYVHDPEEGKTTAHCEYQCQ